MAPRTRWSSPTFVEQLRTDRLPLCPRLGLSRLSPVCRSPEAPGSVLPLTSKGAAALWVPVGSHRLLLPGSLRSASAEMKGQAGVLSLLPSRGEWSVWVFSGKSGQVGGPGGGGARCWEDYMLSPPALPPAASCCSWVFLSFCLSEIALGKQSLTRGGTQAALACARPRRLHSSSEAPRRPARPDPRLLGDHLSLFHLWLYYLRREI